MTEHIYLKCSSSLQWERQDPRVTKEVLHATWMFAERSQVVVIDRKLHSRSDRYRLVIPFRAFLGARFNAATETLEVRGTHSRSSTTNDGRARLAKHVEHPAGLFVV